MTFHSDANREWALREQARAVAAEAERDRLQAQVRELERLPSNRLQSERDRLADTLREAADAMERAIGEGHLTSDTRDRFGSLIFRARAALDRHTKEKT